MLNFPRATTRTHLLSAIKIALLLVFAWSVAFAQIPPQSAIASNAQTDALGKKYADAMALFQGGNREEAINQLRELIQTVHPDPDAPVDGIYEPLFYALAAACFDAQDYAKALAAFTDFSQKFPNSARKADASLAMALCYALMGANVAQGDPVNAGKFIADTIKKYINDPSREAVDQILTQLATLCANKTVPDNMGAAPGQEVNPGAELDDLLGSANADQSPTAKARILFVKAELARLLRQPLEREKDLRAIGDNFKPGDLSSLILGQVGDYLFSKGDMDKASQFYEQLKNEFPKSDYIDFAYAGLGEIAFEKKDYKTALVYFGDGTDKIAANVKQKEVTVGKAKTLLELNQLDEARKLFEQAAAVREWHGEATAISLYSLGQIEMKESKWPDAIAYFQRVFVGYQKFLPWVAKSYLMSGECFQKLGRTQEAVNTYKEMLRNSKLQQLPEAETARQRLKQLGEE